jgi:O-antigen ligase
MDLKRAPLILLLAGLFFAPLLGGQLGIQAMPATSLLEGIRGAEYPQTARLIICLLILGGWLLNFRESKVLQLPTQTVFFPFVIFTALMGLTCAFSAFSWISWSAWLEWLAYGATLIACVSILGRTTGPVLAMGAIALGCVVLGIEGILEYASMRATDPTWRIFTSWVNGNALGGMLLLGIFASMGLMIGRDRLIQLLCGSGILLMGFALVLTQSKGSYLAAFVGLITFGVVLIALKQFKPGLPSFAPWILVVILALAMTRTPNQSAPLARVGAAGETQQQSEGFRTLLWQSSVALMKANPVGYGPGTFRFEATRPALVPQTVMAHQGFLQIGVEGGVAALSAWLAFLGAWGFVMLRGIRNLSPDRQALLSGIIAAVAACMAHNFIDSDWQHFGIGLSFYALLGTGLLVCADGAIPEYLPKSWRTGAVAVGFVGILAWGNLSLVETRKANALLALGQGNSNVAREALETAIQLAPGDGDGYALLSSLPGPDQATNIRRAAENSPSPRNLRMYARFLMAMGDPEGARAQLLKVLTRDPSNLITHKILIEIALANQQQDQAEQQLSKMLAIESTPYFLVRAIPQRIPTETYEARYLVAKGMPMGPEREILLKEAILGFAEYAKVTIPEIRNAAKANLEWAGESIEDATLIVEMGKQALVEINIARPTDLQRPDLIDSERILSAALAEQVP